MINIIIYLISILLIVSLILVYIADRNKVSVQGYLLRTILSVGTYLFQNEMDFFKKVYKKINTLENWKVKEHKLSHYKVQNIKIGDVSASLLSYKHKSSHKVILQIHGGGYELSLPRGNMYLAKKYLKVLPDFSVFTVNYRVAPEHKYPAALQDVEKSYQWLLQHGYQAEDIIIVGDSAGAGLALSLVMYLRNKGTKLPKAMITMSAWTNLTNCSKSFYENQKIDPIFGHSKQTIVYTSRYAKQLEKKIPYVSPVFGTFEKFPDMLMQVGTHEMLLDDTVQVAHLAQKEEVNVTLSIYSGMFHDFQKYHIFLPEAKQAWKEIQKFVQELYQKK